MLANVLLAVLYGYLAVQREIWLFQQRVHREAESLGSTLAVLVVDAWQQKGYPGLMNVIRTSSPQKPEPLRIRWVWFDERPGGLHAPAARTEQLTTVVLEQHLVVEDTAGDGNEYFEVYWPVRLPVVRRGGLEFSHPADELEARKQTIEREVALIVAGMAGLSGLLAVFFGVRYIGIPLRTLIAKTRRIADGHLDEPIRLKSHDELAELAESLNQMCERLAESQAEIRGETSARITAIEQLRHADRLKTVGRLAAGIAHELGTPLNVVAGRAALIQSGRLPSDEIASSAAAIKAEADKMTRIIRQLLDFARTSRPRVARVDLRSVVNRTLDLLRQLAAERRVEFYCELGSEPAMAQIDADQIQQALANLVVNAIQAMPKGGKLRVRIGRRLVVPPDAAVARTESHALTPIDVFSIELHDEGVGIAADDLPHVFEPFFTTKEVGEGTGLGLSITYGIVREHGGWIDVTSRQGDGSCFTINVPAEAVPDPRPQEARCEA
jgi:signal transduction histidine kinase